MRFTLDHFRDEAMTFRRAMTNKKNSICAIDNALGSLFFCINNIEPKDREAGDQIWTATVGEWMRRKELMLFGGHPFGDPEDKPIFEVEQAPA